MSRSPPEFGRKQVADKLRADLPSGRYCTEIRTNERNYLMRYTRPQIIATLPAVSTIKSEKGMRPSEILNPTQWTVGAAYQADE